MKMIFITSMWCPSCLIMRPRYRDVLKNYPQVEVIEYDFDEDTNIVNDYQIGKILPVAIFIDNNSEVKRIIGEKSPKELMKLIGEIYYA